MDRAIETILVNPSWVGSETNFRDAAADASINSAGLRGGSFIVLLSAMDSFPSDVRSTCFLGPVRGVLKQKRALNTGIETSKSGIKYFSGCFDQPHHLFAAAMMGFDINGLRGSFLRRY